MAKIIKVFAYSIAITLLVINPASAADLSKCVGEGTKYPGIVSENSDDTHKVRCQKINGVAFYGSTASDCAILGAIAANEELCTDEGRRSDDGSSYSDRSDLSKKDEEQSDENNNEADRYKTAFLFSLISNVALLAIIGILLYLSKKK